MRFGAPSRTAVTGMNSVATVMTSAQRIVRATSFGASCILPRNKPRRRSHYRRTSATDVATPIIASGVGCNAWPLSTTGCNARSLTGLATCMKPSPANAASASSSSNRNTPVTQALVRMCRMPAIVVVTMMTIATTVGIKSGHDGCEIRRCAQRENRRRKHVAESGQASIAKPDAGPIPRPTSEYSPPAIGNAEDNSA